ncbi:SET and MYND domain protein [Aspergillus ellipticus CBS 707.79]|uniref:SET and MYND domain protein n=1 Tax=Aspergillus ellipticus CBS 707.79 TaxID=1448320 RepID=A0A319DF21_9EURO|nr:SET and MYND domain protein [Aspergillus ellipticus CBS 707.79]
MATKTTPAPAPDGLGRGLFASTDIATGENVLHIPTPFVAVLDKPRLEDTCSGCFGKRHLGNDENTLKGCRGCHVVKYCDKICQAKDWKFAHSLECGIYQQLKPRILPINARAVLRMILRSGRRKYAAEDLEMFLDLETHIKEIREESETQWQRISLCAKAVKTYSGTEMQEEFISAFGAKLDLNSFNLTNAVYDRIGVYLHPHAAFINHSCAYNAVVGFDGDELYIKALRPIPKGDQIFISYIDATNPYPVRQTELRERYYFTCKCTKCEIEASAASAAAPATKGELNLDPTIHKACTLLASASSPATSAQQALSILSSATTLLHTNSIPITTQPFPSLRDELIVSSLSLGKFQNAFAHAALRYTRTDPLVYPETGHPIRQLHAWTLAKLAIHLSQGVAVSTSTSGGSSEGAGEEIALERFEVNFSLIIWSVLGALVGGENAACTVPGFQAMVKAAFADVHREFLAGGLDPRGMGEGIKVEWGKSLGAYMF